jgi:hypothetical protein
MMIYRVLERWNDMVHRVECNTMIEEELLKMIVEHTERLELEEDTPEEPMSLGRFLREHIGMEYLP